MTALTIQNAFQLALKHHQAGQLSQAEQLYRRIISLQPNHADALHLLGVVAHQAGRNDAAVDLIRQAIAIKPNFPEAFCNLGTALKDKGQTDEAIATFARGIALKPDFAEAHDNLGNALCDKGQLDEAIASHRRAIAFKPGYPEAHDNLGNALFANGQLDEAIASHRQAIALRPNWPEAYYNLGIDMKAKGELDEAITCYRRAIALKADYPEAHDNLGNALQANGQLDGAIASYRRAMALKPGNPQPHSNLLITLNYHSGVDARSIAEELRRWNDLHAEPHRAERLSHSNDRSPDRRLRIGYFSPRFCLSPEGRFLLPLLQARDRGGFEVICYSDRRRPDSMTEMIRQSADGWRDIAGWPDQNVADLVRQDQIDIAVDLMLHGPDNRLLVFARKPAPVQVTWLAYCASTGLKTIDYRLSDPYLDPPGGDESIYSEQTIRLPETYWCYQQTIATPAVGPLPALENLLVTFGCLNNFCKVSDGALAAWTRLLRAVPDSHLLLHAHQGSHRQRVTERMQRDGIDPNRLRFAGRLPIEAYFDLYRQIDIALDTFPYCGGTTTFDSLWMGVPVVSLAGNTAVGRAGSSILSNVGLPELVARSGEEYVRLATELAGDLPRLSSLRAELRPRMQQSPLMDAPRFARNIEAAYRRMWRMWAGGNAEC